MGLNLPVLIDPERLALLKSSFGEDGLPMPFLQEILLLECHIAGTSFRDLEAVEPHLKPNDVLELKREPDNQHDVNAIAIYHEKGYQLGYVPREKNEVLSSLLDAGKLIFGKIEEVYWKGNWLRIETKIYMREL